MPPLLYYTLKFASEYTPSKRICSAEPFNSFKIFSIYSFDFCSELGISASA